MARSNFKGKNHTSSEVLELVYTDLCGPITPQSYYGARYYILFVDDYSRMMVVMCMRGMWPQDKHTHFNITISRS